MTFKAGIALDVAALAVEPNLPNLGLVVVDALTLGAGKLIGRAIGKYTKGVSEAVAQRLAQQEAERLAQLEVQAVAEQEARALAERETRELAEKEARELAEREATAKARQAKQEALSRDPQNGKVNAKSISEAATITQAEEAGIVNNPRRPDVSKGEPNLDFAVDGPEPYKYCDVKTPVEPGKFRGTSAETQAERISENIKAQKAGSNNVLHVVDLKNVPAEAKADFKMKVLNKLGSGQGVEFIND